MIIRSETPADYEAIRQLNRLAFGGELEAKLVDRLRADRLVIASLVGVKGQRVVGHILFSTVWIVNGVERLPIASLAPMAVLPQLQRQGIGSALVRAGIEDCRRAGCRAILVVGHPSYYPRFGFSTDLVRQLESPYAGDAFMALELVEGALQLVHGRVEYPEAFAISS